MCLQGRESERVRALARFRGEGREFFAEKEAPGGVSGAMRSFRRSLAWMWFVALTPVVASGAPELKVAEGFRMDRIYDVPKEQGSWVAVTVDDKGQLICADQYGKLYRVSVQASPPVVEPLAIPLSGAHGLLWHDGALYVTVNETGRGGVWKVTDRDGDGTPESPELLKAFQGRGEHGPHQLAASPDGKWIYVVAGNFTELPEMDASVPARVWGEDQLLPRRPDANGHDVDRMAPGGWIARFTPDGKRWELQAIGLRNAYDLAFDSHGWLFTYDSDMEWDLGTPWYRPTRLCHVVPGAEFGWRNGTGKWPEFDEGSLPGVLDLGPGSPTGVLSGKGAKFPKEYQRALYLLDWTYATVRAVRFGMTKEGKISGDSEEFIAGSGLPFTDAVIGGDGAMYLLTGGRKTGSALWRVSYTGTEETSPVDYAASGYESPARPSSDAWQGLGWPGREGRFRSRVALEASPPAEWRQWIETEKEPWRVIDGAIALMRVDAKDSRARVLEALMRLDWTGLEGVQKLNWLRACGLVWIRSGPPSAEERTRLLGKIDARFPSGDAMLDRELCRMLCYVEAPGIVGRTLAAMDAAGPEKPPEWAELASRNAQYGGTVKKMMENLPPAQVLHYVYCLRCVKGPWQPGERERFFSWVDRLAHASGGASYGGFVADLRKQALAIATPEERARFEATGQEAPSWLKDLPKITGPGREWTVDDVVKLGAEGFKGADPENGRRMFRAALCIACHRAGGEGGATGPDLTTVAGRFPLRDLAEAILIPDKTVSDQYAWVEITKTDGSLVYGRDLGREGDGLKVAVNPYDPSQTTMIRLAEIREKKVSSRSPMPPGLINGMNPRELRDLLAWLTTPAR